MSLHRLSLVIVASVCLLLPLSVGCNDRTPERSQSSKGDLVLSAELEALLDDTATYDERVAILEKVAARGDESAVATLNRFVVQYRRSDVLSLRAVDALGNLGDRSSVKPLQNMISVPPRGGDYWDGKIAAATNAAIAKCSE